MSHPSQLNSSTHSLQEKHESIAQKLWSSWMVLLKGHQPFRMDSRCFSVSADELISNESICSTTKRFKCPQSPKDTDLKKTNTKSPLQLGKHCLATALCCWTLKTLQQSCADAQQLDVLRPAEWGQETYLKYHMWRWQKLSHPFQPKLNIWKSHIPLSPITEEP